MNHAPTRRPPRSGSNTIQSILFVLLIAVLIFMFQHRSRGADGFTAAPEHEVNAAAPHGSAGR